MNIELYKEVCEELEIPKFKECSVSLEYDCLLSLGYGKGERAKYCALKDFVPCDFRSKEEKYPDFIPEVQIELIKFFIRQDKLITNYIYTNNEYGITSTDYEHNNVFAKGEDFADVLLEFTLQIARLAKESPKPTIDMEKLKTIIIKGKL